MFIYVPKLLVDFFCLFVFSLEDFFHCYFTNFAKELGHKLGRKTETFTAWMSKYKYKFNNNHKK